jgi:hypothetical protein
MSRDAEGKTDGKQPRLYDKRTVERNIKKGLLTRKDYEKYLKTLDDIADKGVYGSPADDDDDDDDIIEDEAPEAPEGNSHNQ